MSRLLRKRDILMLMLNGSAQGPGDARNHTLFSINAGSPAAAASFDARTLQLDLALCAGTLHFNAAKMVHSVSDLVTEFVKPNQAFANRPAKVVR
jgi:hypothetical protein